MKKINTLQSINSDFFKIKLGTFDKKNPTSVFIEASTYIKPILNDDFGNIKMNIEKKLSVEIKKMLINNPLFQKEYISIVDIPFERMKKGKKTYLYLEYHLKQNNLIPIKELKNEREKFIDNIFMNIKIYLEKEGFYIYKNR